MFLGGLGLEEVVRDYCAFEEVARRESLFLHGLDEEFEWGGVVGLEQTVEISVLGEVLCRYLRDVYLFEQIDCVLLL